ncbi:MAG: DNA primase [Kiritimatiellales bacterium]|nr:DNA primase [Kiritimatiellales bacterium]
MATIPKDQIEEIRFQCNIVDVVGSYLPTLKRMGSTFKCNCPFHQEKTPSFTVNDKMQIFHCFGCQAGGDVFKFVMEYEKVDFVTAVKILADRAGIELRYEGGATENKNEKDVLYKIHQDAAMFYHRMLMDSPEGAEARRYLEERELPPEILKEFLVGFAPNEWDGLMNKALEKGYKAEQLEAAGLVVPSDRNGKKSHYDRFRNRVMFSICDQMGRVIGFSGRIMNAAEKGAKYVNSPETLLFKKNRVLFAFDKARKDIVEARTAIVVEGQIDAIRCHEAGIRNVVASQGTALTENHARLLKRYADEIVLVLDADAAGVKAALASSAIFLSTELSVRVVTLPEKEDPDSLIRTQGTEIFRQLVAEAQSALDYLIDRRGGEENMDSDAGKMRVVKETLALINHCQSAARRDQMLQRAAERLGISIQALGQDMRRSKQQTRTPAPRRTEEPVKPPHVPKNHPKEETSLLELLVHYYPEVKPLVHDHLPLHCLVDPVCRHLVDQLMLDEPDVLTEQLHDFDEETQRVIIKVRMEECRKIDEETTSVELAQQYILLLWRKTLERKAAALGQDAALAAEERFREGTRLKHDISVLKKGWTHALPLVETLAEPPADGF